MQRVLANLRKWVRNFDSYDSGLQISLRRSSLASRNYNVVLRSSRRVHKFIRNTMVKGRKWGSLLDYYSYLISADLSLFYPEASLVFNTASHEKNWILHASINFYVAKNTKGNDVLFHYIHTFSRFAALNLFRTNVPRQMISSSHTKPVCVTAAALVDYYKHAECYRERTSFRDVSMWILI
jgi:hypothetical protein